MGRERGGGKVEGELSWRGGDSERRAGAMAMEEQIFVYMWSRYGRYLTLQHAFLHGDEDLCLTPAY